METPLINPAISEPGGSSTPPSWLGNYGVDVSASPVTLFRMKRKIDDDPTGSNLVVFSSKKQKISDTTDLPQAHFQRLGRKIVSTSKPVLTSALASKILKAKRPIQLDTAKLNKSQPTAPRTSLKRYRVVNPDNEPEVEPANCKVSKLTENYNSICGVKVFDLVEEDWNFPKEEVITCNGVPMKQEVTHDYIYDYFEVPIHNHENIVGAIVDIEKGEDLCYETFREPLVYDESDENSNPSDDDSNAEDNWRNDYPDSETELIANLSFGSDSEDLYEESYSYDGDSDE